MAGRKLTSAIGATLMALVWGLMAFRTMTQAPALPHAPWLASFEVLVAAILFVGLIRAGWTPQERPIAVES